MIIIKKNLIIKIIYIILGIQTCIITSNLSKIQIIKNQSIKKIAQNNYPTNNNTNVNSPISINSFYYNNMQYNTNLSSIKCFFIKGINVLIIDFSLFFIFLELLQYIKKKQMEFTIFSSSFIDLKIKNFFRFIFIVLIQTMLPITIMIILLYDFNKYKKAKNSNDINQYNKYIIDDNNVNQLTKQRRYNFINGLSIGISIFYRILSFIIFTNSFDPKDIWNSLLKEEIKNTHNKIFLSINLIGEMLIFILSISYIILLIKNNPNTIWSSIKNNFKIKDIFPSIGFFILWTLLFIIMLILAN